MALDLSKITPEQLAMLRVVSGEQSPYEMDNDTGTYSLDEQNAYPAPSEQDQNFLDKLTARLKPTVSPIQSLIGPPSSAEGPAVSAGIGALASEIPKSRPFPQPQPSTTPDIAKLPITPTAPAPLSPAQPENLASNDRLKDVQGTRRNLNLMAGLGESLDLLGSGISGTKPIQNPAYENIRKMGEAGVQDYLSQVEFQKQDPKSAVSVGLRDYLGKQFGMRLGDNIAAVDVEKVAPWAVKAYENKIAKELSINQAKEKLGEETRHHKELERLAGEKMLSVKELADQKAAEKADSVKSKALETFGKDIDETQFRAGSNRKAKEAIDRITRLEPLIYDMSNGELDPTKIKDLTDIEMKELAIGMAGALAGTNAPAQTTIQGLNPDSLRKRVAQWTQWFTNNPTGTHQQAFTQRFANMLNREKAANQGIINESVLAKTVTTHNDKYKKYPDEIVEVLSNKLNVPQDTIREYLDQREKNPKAFLKAQREAKAAKEEPKTKEPASIPAPEGTIKIRRKSDGAIKVLSAHAAEKYLNDSENFEQVE